MGRLNHHTAEVLGRFGVCMGAAVLLMLAVGCGSDNAEQQQAPVVGAMPAGRDAARAYRETFLADNPLALPRLDDLVIDHLEATSAEDGDTCANREGVDCIPYVVETPTQLELAIADTMEDLAELDLVDDAGALDETSLSQCVGLDADDSGTVTINELIAAVDEALNS